MTTVVVDAGHGPHNGKGGQFDCGARGNGETEYGVVSRLVQGLEQAFINCEPNVQRTPELSLQDVVKWVNANARPNAILIAVHMNEGTAKSEGTEVVYAHNAPPERGRQAARIAEFVSGFLGTKNRGTLLDTATPAGRLRGLPILRDTDIPAYILEVAFITNKKELAIVKKKGGQAIAELIRAIGKGLLDDPVQKQPFECDK